MNRIILLTVIAVVVVAAALGGAYQFYFKAKIDQYNKHLQQRAQLENKLKQMHQTFEGVKPDVLVKEWKEKVIPWMSAVRQEGRFFEFGIEAVPPVPAEVVSPRLYYEEQYNKMIEEIHTAAYPRLIPVTNFGIFAPNAIPGNIAPRENVRKWLQKLKFGNEMMRLLLNHGAQQINGIDVWPDVWEREGLLMKRTVGLNFVMSAENLAKFLEFLRTADRYYNVEAIKITNPHLAANPPPPLQVEMLLSLAWFNPKKLEEQGGGTTAAAFSSPEQAFSAFNIRSGNRRVEQEELSGFARWWKNFRKNWLPF